MDSVKERKDETIKLLEWGFREYVNINLFKENETIIEADVWLGDKAIIGAMSFVNKNVPENGKWYGVNKKS